MGAGKSKSTLKLMLDKRKFFSEGMTSCTYEDYEREYNDYKEFYKTMKGSTVDKELFDAFFDKGNSISFNDSTLFDVKEMEEFYNKKFTEEDISRFVERTNRVINITIKTADTLQTILGRIDPKLVQPMHLRFDKGSVNSEIMGFSDGRNVVINTSPMSIVTSSTYPNLGGIITNGRATLIHEFGHVIDRRLSNISLRINNTAPISPYGASRPEENFAEAFVSYTTGVKTKYGKSYMSDFEEIMQRVGLTPFKDLFKPK